MSIPYVGVEGGHFLTTAGKRTPIFTDGTVSPLTGKSYMHEWEFNRSVAVLLIAELRRCGFRVLDIAPDEYDVPIDTRVARANDAGVDYFLSIHANASPSGTWDTANGVETLVSKGGSPESYRIGKILQAEMVAATGLRDRCVGLPNGLLERTDVGVLTKTKMPAGLVECGFMTNVSEAKKLLSEDYRKLCAVTFAKALCKAYSMPYIAEAPVKPSEGKTTILGSAVASVAQLVAFVKAVNPNFNPAIAEAFLVEGERYGIRGDIAFCQSIHETGYFRYGGDVKPEQNNFCGLGATGGVPGLSFGSIGDGVRAQMQHLLAYAVKNAKDKIPTGDKMLDPRFNLVSPHGKAPYWEDLGGLWAVPGYSKTAYKSFTEAYAAGATYGQTIMKHYEKLLKVQVTVEPPKVEPPKVEPPAPTKKTKFTDVPAEHWAEESVKIASDAGILGGLPDGTFAGDRTLTRYEMAVVVAKLLKK